MNRMQTRHAWRGNYLEAYVDTDRGLLTEIRAYCPTGGIDVTCEARGIALGTQYLERGDEGVLVVDLRPFRIPARRAPDGVLEVAPHHLFLNCRFGSYRKHPEYGVRRVSGEPEPIRRSGRW